MPEDLFPLPQGAENWNELVDLSQQADPFCCRSEWMLAFYQSHMPNHELVCRRHGLSLLTFALWTEDLDRPVLIPLECGWFFGSPLIGEQDWSLLEALLHEARFVKTKPKIVISGLIPEAPEVMSLLRCRALVGYRIGVVETKTFSASLGGGLDGYLSRRSGNLRHQLRRANRNLEALGVTYERCVPTTQEEADTAFARMLAVERISWKGVAGCGMDEEASARFYHLLLRRMVQERCARVIFARSGGADIGYIYGGLAGTRYRGQQFSFAEEWRWASLGNILQLRQLEWLCEEGALRYDMGSAMAYKRRWAENEITSLTFILEP